MSRGGNHTTPAHPSSRILRPSADAAHKEWVMSQTCTKCSNVNPDDASYCYYDGAVLAGHSANGGPVNLGSQPFPSPFVFPSGQSCRNFDQLATACQNS